MSLGVGVAAKARRELKRLDRATADRIRSAINRYAETDTGDVKKLTDTNPPEYRLRVGD